MLQEKLDGVRAIKDDGDVERVEVVHPMDQIGPVLDRAQHFDGIGLARGFVEESDGGASLGHFCLISSSGAGDAISLLYNEMSVPIDLANVHAKLAIQLGNEIRAAKKRRVAENKVILAKIEKAVDEAMHTWKVEAVTSETVPAQSISIVLEDPSWETDAVVEHIAKYFEKEYLIDGVKVTTTANSMDFEW